MRSFSSRLLCALLAGSALLAGAAQAQGFHHHARIGVGIVIGAPYWGPWTYGPPYGPYYSPYYGPYYPAPVVVAQSAPQTYVEQSQPAPAAPAAGPAATPAAPAGDYWYYCHQPEGYYPYVRSCPAGWEKVPPRPAS